MSTLLKSWLMSGWKPKIVAALWAMITALWATTFASSLWYYSERHKRMVWSRKNKCISAAIFACIIYYAPDHRKGDNKNCFFPSVCLSVAYIANSSRKQRPSVPKFGRKMRCDSHTSFKVKQSKVRVGCGRGHYHVVQTRQPHCLLFSTSEKFYNIK